MRNDGVWQTNVSAQIRIIFLKKLDFENGLYNATQQPHVGAISHDSKQAPLVIRHIKP